MCQSSSGIVVGVWSHCETVDLSVYDTRRRGRRKKKKHIIRKCIFFLVIFSFCLYQHARYLSVLLPSGIHTFMMIRPPRPTTPSVRIKSSDRLYGLYVGAARDVLTDVRFDSGFMLSYFRPFYPFLSSRLPTSISSFPTVPHSRRHGPFDERMAKRAMKIYKRTVHPRLPFGFKIYSHAYDKTQNVCMA